MTMPIAAPPITAASAVATRLVTLPAGVAGTLARSSLIRTSQPNVRRRVSRADGTRVPTCPRRMFGTARDREVTPASCAQGGGSPTMRLPHHSPSHHSPRRYPMFSTRALGIAGSAAAFLALTPALAADAGSDHELDDHGRDGPVLEGRAVLAAQTYVDGPPSGLFFKPQSPINGVTFPTPSQPAIGYSGIVDGRSPGEYLAMPDNGYGNKLNSFDFELRAYYITPDFKTAKGGTGGVTVGDYVAFRDPNNQAGFDIVHKDAADPRHGLLTGADFDPESIQRGPNGDLWLGDEFGPCILHFSADGVLLEPPIDMPDGLVSPANPHIDPTKATIAGTRGLEGMAISPNGETLTFILEGAVLADAPVDAFSRRIYQYDIATGEFTRLADYRTEVAGHFVSDVQALDNHRLVVIERDGGRG